MPYAVRDPEMAQTALSLRWTGSKTSPLHQCAGMTRMMVGRAAQDTEFLAPKKFNSPLSYYHFRTCLFLILCSRSFRFAIFPPSALIHCNSTSSSSGDFESPPTIFQCNSLLLELQFLLCLVMSCLHTESCSSPVTVTYNQIYLNGEP